MGESKRDELIMHLERGVQRRPTQLGDEQPDILGANAKMAEAAVYLRVIFDPENQPSQFGTTLAPTGDVSAAPLLCGSHQGEALPNRETAVGGATDADDVAKLKQRAYEVDDSGDYIHPPLARRLAGALERADSRLAAAERERDHAVACMADHVYKLRQRAEAAEARVRQLEQSLSQAGDSVELAEAEQRGFERGQKAAEARVAELERALTPFAAHAHVAALVDESHLKLWCKDARAALTKPTKEEGERT